MAVDMNEVIFFTVELKEPLTEYYDEYICWVCLQGALYTIPHI